MSVLETPRILFKGEIAWDPITTNNYPNLYDEDTDQPVYPKVADKVTAFRNEAVEGVRTIGNWNPHGTHRSSFYETAISGVDMGAGVSVDDAFVRSAANFTGMLVDLEPYGAYTSQLFFDTMQFGVDGGYRIRGKRNSRITARYVNFSRNAANAMIAGVASVAWQTSFAKGAGLAIDAHDSAALKALAKAMDDEGVLGLTVRFNTYRTVYYDDLALTNKSPLTVQAAQALYAKITTAGGFQPNPARSVMVGVIGLWRKGEPAHEPGDRALIPAGATVLGAAHARVDKKSITLDLSNSIPEVSKDLTKQFLGTLDVIAVDSSGNPSAKLGSVPYDVYDRAAYEATSGIVSLSLSEADAALAAGSDIQLRDAAGDVLLSEDPLRAIPSAPNLYLDEGVSTTATFQIYHHGAPAAGQIPVTLYTLNNDGSTVTNTQQMTTDANGILSLPLTATAGSVVAFAPAPNNTVPATGGLNTQANTYMYFRTWPADSDIAALPPTWDNVYAHVMANWNAMAPCMDNWLMLNDPVQVKNHGPMLKRLTDPANFENFLFMPVTRDMTQGERTLLYKFLDAPPTALAAKLGATPDTGVHRAKLSGKMRRA
jgi:hypothetical protein